MSTKKVLPYKHEELEALLKKLAGGFMLEMPHADFEAAIKRFAEGQVEAKAGVIADAIAAEVVRAQDAEVKLADDCKAANEALKALVNEADVRIEAKADQAQAEVDALELVVGVEGVEADEQGTAAVAASGLFKIIADMKAEIDAEIDANVQNEVDRAAAEEEALNLAIANLQQELQVNIADVQAEVDAFGVFKAIEDAEIKVENKIAGEIAAGDNAVMAQITTVKANLSAEIDKDVKVEADRAVAAEKALQLALDEANAKIVALENKNAELLAALEDKADKVNLDVLEAKVTAVEAFETDINALENTAAKKSEVEGLRSDLDVFKTEVNGKFTGLEALASRIAALEQIHNNGGNGN